MEGQNFCWQKIVTFIVAKIFNYIWLMGFCSLLSLLLNDVER